MENMKAVQKNARGETRTGNQEEQAEARDLWSWGSAQREPSPRVACKKHVAHGCLGIRAGQEGLQLLACVSMHNGGASSGHVLNDSCFSIFYLLHPSMGDILPV